MMFRLALLVLALLMWGAPLAAQEVSDYRSASTPDGPVIEFTSGEFVLADGLRLPATGWKRAANPNIVRIRETDWKTGDFHIMAGRFR
ncbi:MAG TPA: hypothetical protein VLA50_08180, partial [Erythrobacter sp.]|nr:hypothetical protein [Erythrobacter sp.]